MKQTLILISLMIAISIPFVALGFSITNKVNDAYHRGYSDGVRSIDMDKSCVSWMFNENLKKAKERICKK